MVTRQISQTPPLSWPKIRAGFLAGFAALLVPCGALAQDARLGPLDQVRLRVLEWSPVEAEVVDWPALSGDYRIDETGALTVPFVGRVEAGGHTAEEIGRQIAADLRERFALSEAPDVTLDLLSIRTVVVGGLVRAPGAIEYRPGMTVRHALALAGGLEEALTPGTTAYRDFIGNEGQLRVFTDRRQRLLATLARLEAERNETDEIEVPPELSFPAGLALIAEEREVMQRRASRMTLDIEALADQTALLEAEITSLETKVVALTRQRELTEEARENARRLADRGLIKNETLIDAERTLITVESQLLDTSTAILRARQGVSAAARERETLISGRKADVIEQMQNVRSELAETSERITTVSRLIDADTELMTIMSQELPTDDVADPEPVVTIFRAGPDGMQGLVSDLDSTLQPGDLVEIKLTKKPGPTVRQLLPEPSGTN